jgi:hypothetical protein
MRSSRTVSLIAAGLAFGASALQAQSATIQVTATVLSQLTAAAGNPLAFGNVTPGVAKTVAASAAAAGSFNLTGQINQGVQVSFTLPTNLTSGANNLPIGTWTGFYNQVNVQGGTAFIPSAAGQNATLSGTGRLYLWIGATVTPGGAQAAGSYLASVVLNVVYQ